MSASFSKIATVAASTKRPATISGGKAGDPSTFIASLYVTPLIPVSRELAETYSLSTLTGLYETWAQGNLDIKTQDILVVGSVEYPIRVANPFPFKTDTRVQMIVEKPKR